MTSAEKLVFDGVSVVSCASGSLTTSATGAFDCVFSVPGGTLGRTVIATDPSGQTAAGAFAVTTPTNHGGSDPGPLGTKVTVSGTGFSVSTPLASLVFDSQAITTCTNRLPDDERNGDVHVHVSPSRPERLERQ